MTAARSGPSSAINKLEESPTTDAASVTHANPAATIPISGPPGRPTSSPARTPSSGHLVQGSSPKLGKRPVGLRCPISHAEARSTHSRNSAPDPSEDLAAAPAQKLGHSGGVQQRISVYLRRSRHRQRTTASGGLRRRRPPPTTKQPISFPAHAFTPTAPCGAVFTSVHQFRLKAHENAPGAVSGRNWGALLRRHNGNFSPDCLA